MLKKKISFFTLIAASIFEGNDLKDHKIQSGEFFKLSIIVGT